MMKRRKNFKEQQAQKT